MRHTSTIALAAVAAVLATPVAAEAKTKAHHHGKVTKVVKTDGLTAAEQLDLAQQQIAQMQAQLNMLQAKMNAPAPVADTSAALATAKAAEAKADKAIAATEAVKATAVKTDKAVAAVKWAADTSISGRMYINYSNINQQSAGAKTAAAGTGLNIKRMYLGIDHKFDKTFSFNVTTDIANVVGSTSSANFVANSAATPANSTALVGKGFYIKKAYLQAKIDPALVSRVGSADLPWVPYMENQEGHRYLENVLVDRLSFGTSADWGVHVLGNLGKYVDYQVSVVNGGGYRNVQVTNSVDVEGRLSANYNGFFGAIGGYTGKLAQDPQNVAIAPRTAQRFDAAIGYKTAKFTIGGEYFGAKNWKVLSSAPEDSAIGYMLFGSYNFTPKWSAFGKYEWAKPKHTTNAAISDNYFNVGVQWEPVKIVDLSLVYKRDVAENGAIGTSNGTITGIAGGVNGTYDEIGIFGQVRF